MKFTLMTIIAFSSTTAIFATSVHASDAALITMQKEVGKTEHKSKPSYQESNSQPKPIFWQKKHNKDRSCKRANARNAKARKLAGN